MVWLNYQVQTESKASKIEMQASELQRQKLKRTTTMMTTVAVPSVPDDRTLSGGDDEISVEGPDGDTRTVESDREELEDTIEGNMEEHGKMFKYYLPIFPHITQSPEYDRGKRYDMSESFKTVTCVSVTRTELRAVNREMVMLDCGTTEKEECMETLSDRFGEDVEPTTEVSLHIFAKMRHVVKMAMGGEFVDDWSLSDKDRVFKAIYGESYTQRFREKDTGEKDLKHIDEIEEW